MVEDWLAITLLAVFGSVLTILLAWSRGQIETLEKQLKAAIAKAEGRE